MLGARAVISQEHNGERLLKEELVKICDKAESVEHFLITEGPRWKPIPSVLSLTEFLDLLLKIRLLLTLFNSKVVILCT